MVARTEPSCGAETQNCLSPLGSAWGAHPALAPHHLLPSVARNQFSSPLLPQELQTNPEVRPQALSPLATLRWGLC